MQDEPLSNEERFFLGESVEGVETEEARTLRRLLATISRDRMSIDTLLRTNSALRSRVFELEHSPEQIRSMRIAGERLRRAREDSGLSMGDIARALRVSVVRISEIELGHTMMTRDEELSVGTILANRELPPHRREAQPVFWSALAHVEADTFRAVCPSCKVGTLCVQRDGARLLRDDHCICCGQRVRYLDDSIHGTPFAD